MKSSIIGKSLLIIAIILGALIVAFLFYLFVIVKAGPIDSSKGNSVEITGKVEIMYEAGVKDLVFKLKNDPNTYYINRGLENRFDLQKIENELRNQDITLWYAKHRSRPNGGGHMMQLQYKDSIYYTEWEVPLKRSN